MRRPDNNGFTLLEVMVALAVVGILLVGLLQALNYHLEVASRHEARTVTTMLASQVLTETRETPVASEDDFPTPYQDYHYKAEIGEAKYPGIGHITITVTGNGERAVLRELFRLNKDQDSDSQDSDEQSSEDKDENEGDKSEETK